MITDDITLIKAAVVYTISVCAVGVHRMRLVMQWKRNGPNNTLRPEDGRACVRGVLLYYCFGSGENVFSFDAMTAAAAPALLSRLNCRAATNPVSSGY